jgi:hypothetical protein
MGDLTEHYSLDELECKCGCGLGSVPEDYPKEFLELIETRRRILDRPSVPTSGFRCPTHNENEGGVPDSAHTRGALDERVEGGWMRWEAVLASVLAFCVLEGEIPADEARRLYGRMRMKGGGVGVAKTFVHVDADSVKPRPSCWSY